MKKIVMVLMSATAAFGIAVVPFVAQAQNAPGVVRRVEQEMEGKGPHPEIRHAIRSLERTKAYLQSAAHDFGGHRAEALQAVDSAIQQLQICLKYER